MGNPAVRFTGQGKYQVVRNGAGDITVQLSNFDISGSDVKESHKQLLRHTVLEILKGGGSVAILGHAISRRWHPRESSRALPASP